MIKSEAIRSLKVSMKDNGYSTKGAYWFKESFNVIQFMNIQGSLWDTNDFYVNIRIMKKTHVAKKCHPDYEWEIWLRYPGNDMQPEPDKILQFVLETHRQMSSVDAINSIYNEGKLPKHYFRYWDKV